MEFSSVPNVLAASMTAAFVLEFVISRWLLRDQVYHLRDTVTSVITGGVYLGVSLLRNLVLGGVFLAVYAASPWRWDEAHPGSWLVAVVVVDFFDYWSHRLNHTVPLFWALHSTHHSSRNFNLSLGMRNSWFSGYLDWVFLLPASFLGFHPVQLGVVIAVTQVWSFMCHSGYACRLPVIDALFNSPAHHEVHHSADPAHTVCNLGGLLIVWDRLFGTYQVKTSPLRYGFDPAPARPYGIWHLQVHLLPSVVRAWFASASRTRPTADARHGAGAPGAITPERRG